MAKSKIKNSLITVKVNSEIKKKYEREAAISTDGNLSKLVVDAVNDHIERLKEYRKLTRARNL